MADYVYLRHFPEKVTMLSTITLSLRDYSVLIFHFPLSDKM